MVIDPKTGLVIDGDTVPPPDWGQPLPDPIPGIPSVPPWQYGGTLNPLGDPWSTTYKPGSRGKLGIPVGWHIDPKTGQLVPNMGRRVNAGGQGNINPQWGPPPPDVMMQRANVTPGPPPPPFDPSVGDGTMGMASTPFFQPPLPQNFMGRPSAGFNNYKGQPKAQGGTHPPRQVPMVSNRGAQGLQGLATGPIQRGGRKTYPGSRLLSPR